MKVLLLLVVAALLTSCIPVEDLGAYRNKGTIDPALLGEWWWNKDYLGEKKEKNFFYITSKDEMYQIESLADKKQGRKNYQPMFANSLKTSKGNTFMMFFAKDASKGGNLIRYKADGKTIKTYDLSPRLKKYLRERHPEAKNIYTVENDREYPARIKILDNETFKILSEVPEEYWILRNYYE